MIELGSGCRHVTCRCSYEFCYTCGEPWEKAPGQRTCTCELFDSAPAMAEEEQAAPQPRAAPQPAAAPEVDDSGLPFWVPRHVRPVYKTERCMYFAHAGECQRGAMCWFAHGGHELRVPHQSGSLPRTWSGSGSDSDGY